MSNAGKLNMGNITDDKTEDLLAFVKQVAQLKLYETEMEKDVDHANDAIECMDNLILEAREIVA